MKPKFWNKGKIYLSNKDKVLKNIISSYSNEHLNINLNYYHSLINSIIGQQISVTAAKSIKNKFFNLHNNITPPNVLNLDLRFIKKCGLSKQKIMYIKNISSFFIKNKKFIKNIKKYDELFININMIANSIINIPTYFFILLICWLILYYKFIIHYYNIHKLFSK